MVLCKTDKRQGWSSIVGHQDRNHRTITSGAIERLSTTVVQSRETSVYARRRWTVGHRRWLLATLAMPVPVCLSGPCQPSFRVVSLASSPPPRPVSRPARPRSSKLDRQRRPFHSSPLAHRARPPSLSCLQCVALLSLYWYRCDDSAKTEMRGSYLTSVIFLGTNIWLILTKI